MSRSNLVEVRVKTVTLPHHIRDSRFIVFADKYCTIGSLIGHDLPRQYARLYSRPLWKIQRVQKQGKYDLDREFVLAELLQDGLRSLDLTVYGSHCASDAGKGRTTAALGEKKREQRTQPCEERPAKTPRPEKAGKAAHAEPAVGARPTLATESPSAAEKSAPREAPRAAGPEPILVLPSRLQEWPGVDKTSGHATDDEEDEQAVIDRLYPDFDVVFEQLREHRNSPKPPPAKQSNPRKSPGSNRKRRQKYGPDLFKPQAAQ